MAIQTGENDRGDVYKMVRALDLSDEIAEMTLAALECPRLECCAVENVLVAATAERFGVDQTARIFRLNAVIVARFKARYHVANCAIRPIV